MLDLSIKYASIDDGGHQHPHWATGYCPTYVKMAEQMTIWPPVTISSFAIKWGVSRFVSLLASGFFLAGAGRSLLSGLEPLVVWGAFGTNIVPHATAKPFTRQPKN